MPSGLPGRYSLPSSIKLAVCTVAHRLAHVGAVPAHARVARHVRGIGGDEDLPGPRPFHSGGETVCVAAASPSSAAVPGRVGTASARCRWSSTVIRSVRAHALPGGGHVASPVAQVAEAGGVAVLVTPGPEGRSRTSTPTARSTSSSVMIVTSIGVR
jgi:hypothetical protein